MHAPASRIVTLLVVGTVTLAGCATPRTDDGTLAPQATQTSMAHGSATSGSTAAAKGAYVDFTDGAIAATSGSKALFFHAPWCPRCRQLEKELLAQGAPDGLTVFKVDYDSRADLRRTYGVTIQTTIVFVDDQGQEISTIVLYDDPSVAALAAAVP